MIRHIFTLLLIIMTLTGCKFAPKKSEPLGEYADPPIGPDGITIEERLAMEKQRHQQALAMTKLLAATPDREVITHPSALKHPTLIVKYTGKPPTGFLDETELAGIYRSSYMEGKTVVYDTDLAQMTMILERQVDNEPYDYRELTSTVPYGYCLDFIEENLGKASTEPKGYILRKVECSQDKLGGKLLMEYLNHVYMLYFYLYLMVGWFVINKAEKSDMKSTQYQYPFYLVFWLPFWMLGFYLNFTEKS